MTGVLIYRTNPVTTGDRNDNWVAPHKAGNRNRQSAQILAQSMQSCTSKWLWWLANLWVSTLWGNVSILFSVFRKIQWISSSHSLSLYGCAGRKWSVSVRRCGEAIGRWDCHTSLVLSWRVKWYYLRLWVCEREGQEKEWEYMKVSVWGGLEFSFQFVLIVYVRVCVCVHIPKWQEFIGFN